MSWRKGRQGYDPKGDEETKERFMIIGCDIKNGHPQFFQKTNKTEKGG